MIVVFWLSLLRDAGPRCVDYEHSVDDQGFGRQRQQQQQGCFDGLEGKEVNNNDDDDDL